MLTLTVPHGRDLSGQVIMDGLCAAWRDLTNGAPWQRVKDRWGLRGYVAAKECTCGPNGLHAHMHVVFFVDRQWSEDDRAAFESLVDARWREMVTKDRPEVPGGLRPPSREHGVNVVWTGRANEIVNYLTKEQDGKDLDDAVAAQSAELLRGDLKQGRNGNCTPFELLDRPGDATAYRRWIDYVEATKGRRFLTWSRGLRQELGLSADMDLSDEEILALQDEEEEFVEIARVSASTYGRRLRNDPERLAEVLGLAKASRADESRRDEYEAALAASLTGGVPEFERVVLSPADGLDIVRWIPVGATERETTRTRQLVDGQIVAHGRSRYLDDYAAGIEQGELAEAVREYAVAWAYRGAEDVYDAQLAACAALATRAATPGNDGWFARYGTTREAVAAGGEAFDELLDRLRRESLDARPQTVEAWRGMVDDHLARQGRWGGLVAP